MGRTGLRRARQLRRIGRPMLLARADGSVSLTVMGYAPPPQSGQIVDTEAQQPLVVQIGADELAAKPTFGRPRHGDRLTDGTRIYTLTDATAVYGRDIIVGWTLIAVGGS